MILHLSFLSALAFTPLAAPVTTAATQGAPAPATNLEIVVYGRSTDLLGEAGSASEGAVGGAQIQRRGIFRAGEVLETVPGVITTQHAGGGKANQYFLRGFNLDHGTDFLTTLDGVPLNLPSHGHGQGYTDVNVIIPEVVSGINYQKGPYFAENGDFSSAGAAHLQTYRVLPQGIAKVEAGMFGHGRALLADSPSVGGGHLLYVLELHRYDGPWDRPDHFRRGNGIVSYSSGDDSNGFRILGRGYYGVWDSSDQIPESAVGAGLISDFGTLDTATGGESARYSLQGEWHRRGSGSQTRAAIYGAIYELDLFSNFTYFLIDPDLGDQFEQLDRRQTYGLKASHAIFSRWLNRPVETKVGIEARWDQIRNGLFHTVERRRVGKRNFESGDLLDAVIRRDRISQLGLGAYLTNRIRWNGKVRSELGFRGDFYWADVESSLPANSGARHAAMPSPKATVVFGPWLKTELYAQAGLGFHSNDARGVMTRIDPATRTPIDRADPLVRTRGAEFGIRSMAVPNLHSTLAFWGLDIDSELLFVGDAGGTEASRPSRRHGVEWANFYALGERLMLDADVAVSWARFRDDDPAGNHIPGSIETVLATGVTYQFTDDWMAGSRLRYFGPRPLEESNTVRSDPTVLWSATLGHVLAPGVTLAAEFFNLLNRRDQDIAYFYESRPTPEADAVEQIHFHPVEPFAVRVSLTARF